MIGPRRGADNAGAGFGPPIDRDHRDVDAARFEIPFQKVVQFVERLLAG